MKLALGTVQFGLDYGVTNLTGRVTIETCQNILSLAKRSGMLTLDTAAAYGVSEEVLGELEISQDFSILSKVPTLSLSAHRNIIKSVELSLERLKRDSLYGLMLHSEQDLLDGFADEYYEQLLSLKSQGLVNKIGASFYSTEAAMTVLDRYDVDLIQIPANHLDNRFAKSGVLKKAKEKGIEVHARSLFLQGLLVVDAIERPVKFRDFEELHNYDLQARCLGLSPLQLALSYLVQTPLIDRAVVGCVSELQLKEIIEAYRFCEKQGVEIPDLSTDNVSLINPVNWSY